MYCNVVASVSDKIQLAQIVKKQLDEEKAIVRQEPENKCQFVDIIGEAPLMQSVFGLISKVANSDSTVLLLGETGTGKELVAKAIHDHSPRRNKPMIKINCAALPVNLIESELFGHERGSFTGAIEKRLGKFELANGGSLFLDEIGEMPLDFQVKLLRVLQEREIERIGGKTVIKVDVRIIAATNRNLKEEMGKGRFRSDLYYRLNIFPITLPTLRERPEDIPLLTAHFISKYCKKIGRSIKTVSKQTLKEMLLYHWPGNIRELEHLIERNILLAEDDMLRITSLPSNVEVEKPQLPVCHFRARTIDENERFHILETLNYCRGRVAGYAGAAELLGVPPSTLFSKMKKLGIRRKLSSENEPF